MRIFYHSKHTRYCDHGRMLSATPPPPTNKLLEAWLWLVEPPVRDQESQIPPHILQGRCRRRRLRALVLGVAVLGVLVGLVAGFLHYRQTQRPYFSGSMTIASARAMVAIQQELKPRLTLALAQRAQVCGVAAVNLGRYVQYMVLRQPDHSFLYMANPQAPQPLPGSTVEAINETSHLCLDPYFATRRRHSSVRISYRDHKWEWQTAEFHRVAAVCVQHFYDIMQGNWPCDPAARTLEVKHWTVRDPDL